MICGSSNWANETFKFEYSLGLVYMYMVIKWLFFEQYWLDVGLCTASNTYLIYVDEFALDF